MELFEKAMKRLQDVDIKPSYQRVKVLEYLMRDQNHPTADEIYQNLHKETPTLSKATVYNTLRLFEERKLVSTMSADRVETRYDLLTEGHGHFVCTKCETIFNFPYTFKNEYEDLDGFDIASEEIVLKGICKDCQKK